MEQQQNIAKRYWIIPAVCCFLLSTLMVISLVAWSQPLTAVLTTAVFIVIFVASGVLYLLSWRPIIKAMQIVMCVFYLLVALYWWQTGQLIGVLPCALAVLLVWQNARLEKANKALQATATAPAS
jgi:high-affinity K+ transport system ATPase subunit B